MNNIYHSKLQKLERINAPGSWKNHKNHWKTVMVHPWYQNLLHIYNEIYTSIHKFFSSNEILCIPMPVTTASISSPMGLGSDSLPVEVDLFGVKTFLADSMQFMLEFGCRIHQKGVYYIMPCFRGEATDQYHLPQFNHIEAEIPGLLSDAITLSSNLIHYISCQVLENCPDHIRRLAGTIDHVQSLAQMNSKYPKYYMKDIIQELNNQNDSWVYQDPLGFEILTRAGEAEFLRRYGENGVAWITNFDALSVPFYQAYDKDSLLAYNADLILGTCEVVGSGQRHITADQVKQALGYHNITQDPYEWYIEMRNLNPIQTSGFGIGIERYLLWLLNHDDIRDITFLHRENGVDIIP